MVLGVQWRCEVHLREYRMGTIPMQRWEEGNEQGGLAHVGSKQ